ncbi:MAG: DegT/DnrJ/EryC1/StrS family aminotransferase [Flavobacteriales bacterium]|nr:DegT/DnrJ/EryC1/StrS family aminotransferase [Flavobacteriales bacterium]MCB0778048.1 DegT/DnrJ/EryC1/StrS family aminotransferase [Flavobacteriales bacterium]MCB0807674.1 DegT/DnrJ/EryC1/StrS family aminotransferase [Flavobacteriales bacterium]
MHRLKLIFDCAPALGTNCIRQPLLGRGYVITCSFHATKLFHTVEGGYIVAGDPEVMQRLRLLPAFGHMSDGHFLTGGRR